MGIYDEYIDPNIAGLLEQLCPDGVEMVRLGNIAYVQSGWGFPRKYQGKLAGDVPFYKVSDMNSQGNEMFMNVANNYVSKNDLAAMKAKTVPAGSVIFPKIGAAIATNKKRILSKASSIDNNVSAIIPSEAIVSRFVFYWMLGLDLVEIANDSGAVPSIRKTDLEVLEVPLPPVAVQQQIVDILDAFSDLGASLRREKELRQKQLTFVLNQLYEHSEYEVKQLSEVGQFIKGRGILKSDLMSEGVPAFHYGQVHSLYGNTTSKAVSFIKPDLVKNPVTASYGDIVLATTSEDDDDVAKPLVWLGNEEAVVGGDAHVYRHELDPYYAGYFFTSGSFLLQKLPKLSGTKVRRINDRNLAKIEIPVPPMDLQREYGKRLQLFETYINGLDREIELRQQQFEFYRERLLSLPVKN